MFCFQSFDWIDIVRLRLNMLYSHFSVRDLFVCLIFIFRHIRGVVDL